jgi:16S rRNA (cytosine967-C5)-methyltransferase
VNVTKLNTNANSAKSRIRKLAISVLSRYERVSASARAILRETAKKTSLSGKDAASLNMLVLGVIKRLNTIDFIIAQVLKSRSPASLSFTGKAALRLAIFEGRWLGVPFKIIKETHLRNETSLVSPIRKALEFNLEKSIAGFERVGQLSIMLSHPTFMVETLLENMSDDQAIQLMKVNNSSPEHYIRLNRLLVSDEEESDLLNDIDAELILDGDYAGLYHVAEGIDTIVESEPFETGRVLIHDKASVAAVDALSPSENDLIWDACAAPGMKTQLIAENLSSSGRLVASDVYRNRVRLGIRRCKKMGCDFSEWLLADASYPPIRNSDKILIDAPCTSTGILQRDPSYKWRLNKQYLSAMMTIQHKILDSVVTAFQETPGVEIIYATCSLLPHEGESQIDSILASHDIELVDLDLNYSTGYDGFKCSSSVRRLFPHTDKTNAFFISKLRIPQ